MATVNTPAGPLTVGETYNLTLTHGSERRQLPGAKIVTFKDDQGQDRYEAQASNGQTIGFLPNHVYAINGNGKGGLTDG